MGTATGVSGGCPAAAAFMVFASGSSYGRNFNLLQIGIRMFLFAAARDIDRNKY